MVGNDYEEFNVKQEATSKVNILVRGMHDKDSRIDIMGYSRAE